ncbi:PREDICTED: uncharacterized protein LOC104803788 [Tarenaya hassleriana]|uniref:uncharacterized protein LOC104803788 n=1 Tax=Tarenaya hassleriana TaxID=28532 RepID=UPI00053C1947|nr:PREDICTED: uncharacterized protein LOC104803788 [Tarenaya hassleriana]
MSMPLYLQPPPATEHSSSSSAVPSGSSVGPLVAVLVVVAVLCVIAGFVGRICSGKTVMGFGEYDMERWAESRCSSCIDGHIPPPPPPPPEPQQRNLHGDSEPAVPGQDTAETGDR